MQIEIHQKRLGKHTFVCAEVGPWQLSASRGARHIYARAVKCLPGNWGSVTLAGCGQTAGAAIAVINESLEPLEGDLAADVAGAFEELFAELDMPASPASETVIDRFDAFKSELDTRTQVGPLDV